MTRFTLAAGLVFCVAACGPPPTGPVEAAGPSAVMYEAQRAAEKRWRPDEALAFDVEVGLIDAYGNESTDPALGFSWSASELGRVNRENADGYRLMNLATVTIRGPYGVMALAEWCGDEDDRVLTPRLCGAERRRAEDAWVLLEAEAIVRTYGSTAPQGPGS